MPCKFALLLLAAGALAVHAQAPATPDAAVAIKAQPAPAEPSLPPGIDLNNPQVLFNTAADFNALDDEKRTPWHIVANYETFDDAGKSQDEGVYEEWRVAPDKWKRTYTSPKYTQTEFAEGKKHLYLNASGAPQWPLSLIGQEISHPLPPTSDLNGGTPELRPLANNGAKLSCLLLADRLKHGSWPIGLVPTVCFNNGTAILRLQVFDGSVQEVRNQISAFRGSYFARDLRFSDDDKPLLHVQVTQFNSLTPEEAQHVAEVPTAKVDSMVLQQVGIASGVATGLRIGGPNPSYPLAARQNHIQGTVVLDARIGPDGRIHSLRVLSSPDDLLTISAIAAVERWVYKPYLLNGEPVAVRTRINVVYHMSDAVYRLSP